MHSIRRRSDGTPDFIVHTLWNVEVGGIDGIVGQSLALLVDIATEIDKTLELNEGRESDTSATSLVVYII